MKKTTVAYVLSVEQQARALVEDARQEIARTKAELESEEAARRVQKLDAARERAASIRKQGESRAAEVRAHILDQAEAEASELEAQASTHWDEAIALVWGRVLGRQ